jgi:hypothetical protein
MSYPEAFRKFRASTKAAVEFNDPNWTNSAITRERVKRLTGARAELLATLPPETARKTAEPSLRAKALEQLRPTNADTVAVTSNEWGKVKALLDAGRNLERMIQQADRTRLAAIIDRLPTELAVQYDDADDSITEVEELVLARLVELGDQAATQFQEAQQVADYETAWVQVIQEAVAGEVSVGALTALYRATPEEHEATVGEDPFDEGAVASKVQHLDRLAESIGGGQVAAVG